MAEAPAEEKARIDKWLWAARFFRTRGLAAEAIAGGKVRLNDVRAKPGKGLHIGDTLRIRKDIYEFVVIVQGLSVRRGPAEEAKSLYRETEESILVRAEIRELLRLQPSPVQRKGPLTKKDRRELIRFKRGW